MANTTKSLWLAQLSLILLSLMVLAGLSWAGDPNPCSRKNYQVFAFNDLGMHCYDGDFSVFSLLPPFNVIHSHPRLQRVQEYHQRVQPPHRGSQNQFLGLRGVAFRG
jgi:hypothetical protein